MPPRKQVNTPKNRAALRARDGWRCVLCEKPFADPPPAFPHPESVQVDHIVQVWKSGGDELGNLRLVHRRCNMKRQDEELSPAQMARNERTRAYWAGAVGQEGANELEAALHREEVAGRQEAIAIMRSRDLKPKKH